MLSMQYIDRIIKFFLKMCVSHMEILHVFQKQV